MKSRNEQPVSEQSDKNFIDQLLSIELDEGNISVVIENVIDELISELERLKSDTDRQSSLQAKYEDEILKRQYGMTVEEVLDSLNNKVEALLIGKTKLSSATKLDMIFIPPDEIEISQKGDGSSEQNPILQKGLLFLYALHQSGVDIDSVKVYEGVQPSEAFRQVSYRVFIIRDLNKAVFICDEYGNATYAFDLDLDVEIGELASMTKNQLNEYITIYPAYAIRIENREGWIDELMKLIIEGWNKEEALNTRPSKQIDWSVYRDDFFALYECSYTDKEIAQKLRKLHGDSRLTHTRIRQFRERLRLPANSDNINWLIYTSIVTELNAKNYTDTEISEVLVKQYDDQRLTPDRVGKFRKRLGLKQNSRIDWNDYEEDLIDLYNEGLTDEEIADTLSIKYDDPRITPDKILYARERFGLQSDINIRWDSYHEDFIRLYSEGLTDEEIAERLANIHNNERITTSRIRRRRGELKLKKLARKSINWTKYHTKFIELYESGLTAPEITSRLVKFYQDPRITIHTVYGRLKYLDLKMNGVDRKKRD